MRFNSDFIGYDAGFGNVEGYDPQTEWIPWEDMPVSATLGIGQYTVLILSQDD